MKIALVTTSFLPMLGGAEFVVHHLAREWQMQGHEVCVFNSTSDTIDDKKIALKINYGVGKFHVLRGSNRFCPHSFPFCQYNALSIKRKLDNFKPDLISAHFGYPVGVWLNSIKPAPNYLITCHGRDLTTAPWGYRNRYSCDKFLISALNKSIAAIAISSFARKQMEDMGVDPLKIVDISNGVELDRFTRKVHFNVRDEFGIPRDAILVLSVGANSKDKDYESALAAFNILSRAHDNVYYLVVGDSVDELKQHPSFNEKIILCEKLYGDTLVSAYQNADIYFSSSVSELCPLVVLEALASGVPQVVTNVSGSQDIIENGVNGFVAEPKDTAAMAMALEKLLLNKELRKTMSSTSKKRAHQYSWNHISKQYLELLNR